MTVCRNVLCVCVFLTCFVVVAMRAFAVNDVVPEKESFLSVLNENKKIFQEKLDTLRLLEKDEAGFDVIDQEKIELFELMENIISDKRLVCQKKVEKLDNRYDRIKATLGVLENETLNIFHERISMYRRMIDRMSQCINAYRYCREKIGNTMRERNKTIITDEGLVREQKEIVLLLAPLFAKRKNLLVTGGSPDQIVSLRRNCRDLHFKFW